MKRGSSASIIGMLRKGAIKEAEADRAGAAPTAEVTPSSETSGTSPSSRKTRTVRVAVQGCSHGDLNLIYEACQRDELSTGKKIDVLLCCGDFQCVRNREDMRCMAVPDKYKTFGDFKDYYEGKRVAKILTLFIGGNHEASNVLADQYYGGFVAQNIFYLGHSSVVQIKGLTIAALSGIFKGHDFGEPYPRQPLNSGTIRSAYHVRSFEIEKLEKFADALAEFRAVYRQHADYGRVHIMMSHDWPVGITDYGDVNALLRVKPYFKDDIAHKALGNPHTMPLLRCMKPEHWLSAHLHVHFEAEVRHQQPATASTPSTRFIALDKCAGVNRTCLTFLDIEVPCDDGVDDDSAISLHPVWQEIIKQTHHLVQVADGSPGSGSLRGGGVPWMDMVRADTNPAIQPRRLADKFAASLEGSGNPRIRITDTDALLNCVFPFGGGGARNPLRDPRASVVAPTCAAASAVAVPSSMSVTPPQQPLGDGIEQALPATNDDWDFVEDVGCRAQR